MWLCGFLYSSVYVRTHMCVWCRLNDGMYIYMCVQGRDARGWQGIGVCGLGNQGRLPGRVNIE